MENKGLDVASTPQERRPQGQSGVAATPSERDALAARMFPADWARVAALTGERARRQRHNLRRRALVAVQLRDLRERGASCGTCRYLTGGVSGVKGPICDAHSDFHGYAITTLDGLCADWTSRKASQTAGEPREGALERRATPNPTPHPEGNL